MHGLNTNHKFCETPPKDVVADANAIVVLAYHLISELTAITKFHQQIQEVFILRRR